MYDHLGTSTVGLGVAARRLSAVVEATSNGVDNPNWDTARHFTGTTTVFDLALHGLRVFAKVTAKDEAEIDTTRPRWRPTCRVADDVASGFVALVTPSLLWPAVFQELESVKGATRADEVEVCLEPHLPREPLRCYNC